MALTKEIKDQIIAEYHLHEKDTGSVEVQIALLTKRIQQLTEHLQKNKHDISSRRGLLKLVSHRKHLLAYLRGRDYQQYLNLTQRLNLRSK